MSIFSDNLTYEAWLIQSIRIVKAFPVNKNWLDTFGEAVIANKFSGKRLAAAIDNVIRTHTHGTVPNYGEFLSFDKKIELMTEYEMTKKANIEGAGIRNYYEIVEIEGKPFYTAAGNAEKYGLKIWKPEEHKKKKVLIVDESRPEAEETAKVLREVLNSIAGEKIVPEAEVKHKKKRKYTGDYKNTDDYKKAQREFEEELKANDRE